MFQRKAPAQVLQSSLEYIYSDRPTVVRYLYWSASNVWYFLLNLFNYFNFPNQTYENLMLCYRLNAPQTLTSVSSFHHNNLKAHRWNIFYTKTERNSCRTFAEFTRSRFEKGTFFAWKKEETFPRVTLSDVFFTPKNFIQRKHFFCLAWKSDSFQSVSHTKNLFIWFKQPNSCLMFVILPHNKNKLYFFVFCETKLYFIPDFFFTLHPL